MKSVNFVPGRKLPDSVDANELRIANSDDLRFCVFHVDEQSRIVSAIVDPKQSLSTTEIATTLLLSLPTLKRLNYFALTGSGVLSDDVVLMLLNARTLEQLYIQGCPTVTNRPFVLVNRIYLKELGLIYSGTDNLIIEELVKKSSLRRLDLRGTKIDSIAVEHLCRFETLQEVILDEVDLTAENLSLISNSRPDISIVH